MLYQNKKSILLLLLLLGSASFSWSQSEIRNRQLVLVGGIGNYEVLHIGLKVPIRRIYHFETAIGFNPLGISGEKYKMANFSFGRQLFGDSLKSHLISPSIQLKTIIWNMENIYNRFLMLGAGLELGLRYKFNSHFELHSSAGVIYNSLLLYQRRTDLEVGWPKDFAPSFSLQLNYWIR